MTSKVLIAPKQQRLLDVAEAIAQMLKKIGTNWFKPALSESSQTVDWLTVRADLFAAR